MVSLTVRGHGLDIQRLEVRAMSELTMVARLKIHDGKLDVVKHRRVNPRRHFRKNHRIANASPVCGWSRATKALDTKQNLPSCQTRRAPD